MSAIWGCVDFSGGALPEDLAAAMQKPFEGCRIDRFETICAHNAMMGCGLQYIKPNASDERHPVREGPLLFTADCMLDGPEKLAGRLGVSGSTPPDGALLYRAYSAHGPACNNLLYGAYSFAAWHAGEGALTLSVDHIGSRVLYYCRAGSRVYFSTLIRPIVAALNAPPALNERWLADYLTLPFVQTVTDPQETIYEGIYKVEPGEYMVFTAEKTERHVHWDPLATPPLELPDDAAYKAHFLALMHEVAADYAGCGAQLGVYQSGGMDSTAVAAVVARELAKRGGQLNSYTFVPMKDYEPVMTATRTEDERGEVKQLCGMYPNIRPAFCGLDEADALTWADELLEMHEYPFKALTGNMWILGIAKQARAEGCRVMLNGQKGNHTISYGDVFTEALTLWRGGHPLRALNTLNHYGRRNKRSRKQLLLWLWEHKGPVKEKDLGRVIEEVYQACYVNRSFAESHGSVERILKRRFFGAVGHLVPFAETRRQMLNKTTMSLVAENAVKVGLATGIIIRDFTSDRRIFEFCCAAPMSCFVRDGWSRRLVADYMADYLPERIAKNVRNVGYQDADFIARLGRRWPERHAQLSAGATSPRLAPYTDTRRVREDLSACVDGLDALEYSHIYELFGLYMAGRALEVFPFGGAGAGTADKI